MRTILKLKKFDRRDLKIIIVASHFHMKVTNGLLKGCLRALKECKVKQNNITIIRVPGSFEIPFAINQALKTGKFDAVVALGAIVKGETKHDEYLALAITQTLLNLSIIFNKPIGFGIITALNLKQAIARSRDDKENRGYQAAYAALGVISSVV